MKTEMDSKVNQLSYLEQQLQNYLAQRQNLQSQLLEAESAIEALSSSESSYKIIGNLMVKSDKKDLLEELNLKKKTFEMKIKSIQKQEDLIKDKESQLQKEIMDKME